MYKSFHVQSFRGLRDVALADLGRINLVSGRNDMGKTALLEAIYLHASGPLAGINALQRLQPLRAQQPIEVGPDTRLSPWETFFENLDVSREIRLTGSTNSTTYELGLVVGPPNQSAKVPVGTPAGTIEAASASLRILESYNGSPAFERVQTVTIQNPPATGMLGVPFAINFSLTPPATEPFCLATLVRGFANATELAQLYSFQRTREPALDVVGPLQVLDDRITDLEILTRAGQPVLHAALSDGLLVPVSLLGDGPVLFSRYLLSMATVAGGVLLIDEIENGLHWSVLPHVWRSLTEAARLLHVQVFATTHSREALAAALDGAEGEELRLFRLGPRGPDGAPLVGTYDREKLRAGLELELDLR